MNTQCDGSAHWPVINGGERPDEAVATGRIQGTQMSPESEQIITLFHPFAFDERKRVELSKKRFVHYTTATAAVSILRNKEVWMRNVTCMNDYSEVEHGIQCLKRAYNLSPAGKRLKAGLEACYPGITKEIEDLFNNSETRLRYSTHVSCFSLHEDEEDVLGRLSMWRAYGRNSGVALVFKSDVFFSESDALRAWSSPVAYLSEESFGRNFELLVDGLLSAEAALKQLGREEVRNRLFFTFVFACTCTKHDGFKEELEWRVVHFPSMYPCERLAKSVELIGTIPQLVYKIPLKNVPEEGLTGIEIPEFLDRIIIGPTDYPLAVKAAFAELLRDAGVEDPESKITISWIPLRI